MYRLKFTRMIFMLLLIALSGCGEKKMNYYEDRDPIFVEAPDFYMIVMSDPQLDWACATSECRDQANSTSAQASLSNRWQVESVQKLKERYGDKIKGVIMNGDLTSYGHSDELKKYRSLYTKKIGLPIYPGLGNHDYANNVDDCFENECALRMVKYLRDEVYALAPLRFDYGQSNSYYKFSSNRKDYQGSLAYSFEIDKVHFIQLNNYPTYKNSFNGWDFGAALRDYVSISSAMDWLKKDLEDAQKRGMNIMINFHDFNEHFLQTDYATFIKLTSNYNILGIFTGHIHADSGVITKRTGALGSYSIYRSGSAEYNTYLLAHFEDGILTEVKQINAINGEAFEDGEFTSPINL